ncbi:alpha/beta fold hydrolase [Kineosporia mesophila]|uniref:Alpha/beta fold hydrolase n=1 Tax=Kineosporia mesophila TaxID=566012 RepID=A0ABP6ZNR7_9ACTN|nr:alpha/beta fold hydrolase [Kineosporia mesophila]MCD5354464.1 alpha/beta fold hydrolase [Kineosporia mesophila]
MTETPVAPELLTHESTLRELTTDKGVLRYHEAGQGPPLVLLHGSGPGVSGWRNFSGSLGLFAGHFRTLILEFPGFGISDPTDEHAMLGAPATVLRFLDGLGLDRVDLIGNSMGGQVATKLALTRPERVRRLVTIGGIGRNLYAPMPSEGLRLLTDFVDDPTRPNLVRWLRGMVFDQSLITEELIEDRLSTGTEAQTLATARSMFGSEALKFLIAAAQAGGVPEWAQLGNITAPTLLTWGRDDRVTPLDSSIIPMRAIPNGELHVFPNSGHWVMIEAKEAWESVVLAFLTRPDACSDAS